MQSKVSISYTERRTDDREKKTIETTERTALEEAMTAKDAHDRGILNAFGILRSSPQTAPSFEAPAPIHVFKGASSGLEPRYVYDTNSNHCNPSHAVEGISGRLYMNSTCKPPQGAERITGRVSANVNSKPPHVAERIPGRLSDNTNSDPPHAAERISRRLYDRSSLSSQTVERLSRSLFDDDTKTEWFFDESRSRARQKWVVDRKAAKQQFRDPDFLEKHGDRRGIGLTRASAPGGLRERPRPSFHP